MIDPPLIQVARGDCAEIDRLSPDRAENGAEAEGSRNLRVISAPSLGDEGWISADLCTFSALAKSERPEEETPLYRGPRLRADGPPEPWHCGRHEYARVDLEYAPTSGPDLHGLHPLPGSTVPPSRCGLAGPGPQALSRLRSPHCHRVFRSARMTVGATFSRPEALPDYRLPSTAPPSPAFVPQRRSQITPDNRPPGRVAGSSPPPA